MTAEREEHLRWLSRQVGNDDLRDAFELVESYGAESDNLRRLLEQADRDAESSRREFQEIRIALMKRALAAESGAK